MRDKIGWVGMMRRGKVWWRGEENLTVSKNVRNIEVGVYWELIRSENEERSCVSGRKQLEKGRGTERTRGGLI